MKQTKMSKFTIFYIVSAIIVGLLFVASFTFAWYSQKSSKTIGIVFSKPIVIMLNSEVMQVRDSVEVNNGENLLPGSKVSVNLGFRMADIETTAPAYVRARINPDFDDIYDDQGKLVRWDSSEYISYTDFNKTVSRDNLYSWTEVNFSKSGKDVWFVLTIDGQALQAQPGQSYDFYNGEIELKKTLTNIFAEKKITLNFEVEAIQTTYVGNPLTDPTNSAWGVE